MAVRPILAEFDDGALESKGQEPDDGAWQTPFMLKARQGNNVATDTATDPVSGAKLTVGGYMGEAPGHHLLHLFQAWVRFLPAKGFFLANNEQMVSASMRLSLYDYNYNRSGDDSLQGWTSDTTFPLSSGSWRDLEQLRDNFFYDYEFYQMQLGMSTSTIYEAGGEQFLLNLQAKLDAGDEEQHLFTTWSSLRDFPGGTTFRLLQIKSANSQIEDRWKPHLVLRTHKIHDLNMVGSSSIQMSDGTGVFLRYDRPNNRIGLYYQRVQQTSATLIGWIPTDSGASPDYYKMGPGFQTFSITRDAKNNVYVAGMRGPLQGNHNAGVKLFNVHAFKYNGNYSWTQRAPITVGENSLGQFETSRALPNNFSAVWVPNSSKGSAGQLAVVYSHRDAQWGKNQLGVMTVYAGFLTGDSGASKSYGVNYADIADQLSAWRPFNASATGIDTIINGDTVRFSSFVPAPSSSDTERSAIGKVTISTSHVVGKPTLLGNSINGNSPHDPDTKIRMLELGSDGSRYAIARQGLIEVRNISDDSLYRQIDLTASGIAGFPTRATLQSSQVWDVVWDRVATGLIWIYYRDSNNPRLLRKISWNYVNSELGTSFQLTPSPLSESGSSIEAIRVPRGYVDTRCVLVDVAMETGAGDPIPLITLRDTTMNWAPSAPVIDPIASFNASSTKQVDWLFGDANSSDFASAQDVEIRNVETGSIVLSQEHTTVQVASTTQKKYRFTIPSSTLTNDTVYQIRFKSYDSVDFPSEWSEWVQFSTTATGGFVEITNPAADIELLNQSELTVEWSYHNSTPSIVQTGYRVRTFNNETNVVTSDSGVIMSAATSYQLTNLLSDVQYRIEVTILDSNGQTSGAGIRLVTPDYNNPSIPQIVANAMPGYIEIRVQNPPPTGENPITVRNYISRKETANPDEEFATIGECPPNGVYQDWTVAAGVSYTYKARGSSE